ncbi:hypothetical protein CDEST_01225 [Colletotrichum destructivum]|uniref:Uncharacterized protein n=1 Tax=Colletotrichum destructivum TaxID=34406 RepID=A0AAX4HZE5_9PEZI|nr:hypothetical protein CDEST_01225 [Colletotrichum destructivum]
MPLIAVSQCSHSNLAVLCASTGQPARCRFIGDDFAMVFLLRAQRGLTILPSAITVPRNCFFV